MDITIRTGLVQAGQYGIIHVKGDVEFDCGVRFRLLELHGSVYTPELIGHRVQCNGDIMCDGNMQVGGIHGHGSLRIDGDGWCDTLQFTGLLDVAGILHCNERLEINGKLINKRLIRADTAHLNGVLHGKELRTRDLRLRPLDSALLTCLAIRRYTGSSSALNVRGESVEVHRLSCHSINASSVRVGAECWVEKIVYDKSLDISPTAHVTSVHDSSKRQAQAGSVA